MGMNNSSSANSSPKIYTYKKTLSKLEIAKAIKNSLQYAIGIFVILFTVLKIIQITFFTDCNLFNTILPYYYSMRFLDIISKGLLASTAIELGYMLFTPGPDEAVVPIITGLAAFMLTIMSEPPNFNNIIGIGILTIAMGCLFRIKSRYLKEEPTVTEFCISSDPNEFLEKFSNEIHVESFIHIDSILSDFIFDSTNKNVAEIDVKGIITIIGEGLTYIKIIHNGNGEKNTLVHRIRLTVKTVVPLETDRASINK